MPQIHRSDAPCCGYADRVISGARPANLPVGPPTKFELIINLKTQLPPAWLQASIGQPPTLLSLRSARILGPKRLELLREFLPPGATVAVLRNRTNPICDAESSEIEAAAPLLRLRLGVMTINADSLSELDSAFVSIQTEVSGLLTNDASLKYSTAILAARWRGADRRKGRYSGP